MACEVCQIPAEDEAFLLFAAEHWKVYLSFKQSYLGRCFIPLRRHAGSLSELYPEEWLELAGVTVRLEAAIRKAFGATLFNWACLMNAAYQEAEPEPHVHWHVRPRYDGPVELEGLRFEDPAFGHHYRNGEHMAPVPYQVRLRIAERIRECL